MAQTEIIVEKGTKTYRLTIEDDVRNLIRIAHLPERGYEAYTNATTYRKEKWDEFVETHIVDLNTRGQYAIQLSDKTISLGATIWLTDRNSETFKKAIETLRKSEKGQELIEAVKEYLNI